MEGILNEVKGNLVVIDSKWYKVLKPDYLPKVGVKVSFSVTPEDPTTIKFIKAVTVAETKVTTAPTVAGNAPIKKEAAPVETSTYKEPKATGYGSEADVRGKQVGCAINAAAAILSGIKEEPAALLVKMKLLVEGILKIAKDAGA